MRHKLALAQLTNNLQVASAGTHGYHTGEPPDPRAISVAARRGYDLSGLRAKVFSAGDFRRFDWILAMDRTHLAALQRMKGAAPGDSPLLMTTCSIQFRNIDVPDPYYGDTAGFERVLDMVEETCDCLIQQISGGPG
jgi:protein-tyrosine phosphatase